jgi:hypothetical protein
VIPRKSAVRVERDLEGMLNGFVSCGVLGMEWDGDF